MLQHVYYDGSGQNSTTGAIPICSVNLNRTALDFGLVEAERDTSLPACPECAERLGAWIASQSGVQGFAVPDVQYLVFRELGDIYTLAEVEQRLEDTAAMLLASDDPEMHEDAKEQRYLDWKHEQSH